MKEMAGAGDRWQKEKGSIEKEERKSDMARKGEKTSMPGKKLGLLWESSLPNPSKKEEGQKQREHHSKRGRADKQNSMRNWRCQEHTTKGGVTCPKR